MKKISLNIGDEVIIRSDLIADKWYGDNAFIEDMNNTLGRKVTIEEFHRNGFFIKESGWNYTPEMIDVDKTYELQNKIMLNIKEGESC